jgi:hypothetical protein
MLVPPYSELLNSPNMREDHLLRNRVRGIRILYPVKDTHNVSL